MIVKKMVFSRRHFLGTAAVGATALATTRTALFAANPARRSMSHRERVEKALALEETDRLPFGFWWHFPNQDRAPRRLAQLSLELQQKLDLDFIKFSPYGLYSVVDWGVTLDVRGGTLPPEQAEYPIKQPEDWRRLRRLRGTEGEYLIVLEAQRIALGKTTAPGPAWLRTLLGDNFFANVVDMHVYRDAGLEDLRYLPQLKYLYVGANITDEGIVHINGLTQLQSLTLAAPNISAAGLENLKGLTQLKGLYFEHVQISDAGLENIKRLTQLQWLGMSGSPISDAGLKHIEGLTQLKFLSLEKTRLTDAGLEHLKGLTQLEGLWLTNTKVSDAGLEDLKGLTQLQRLYLDGTQVTRQGVQNLQRGLPKCSIVAPGGVVVRSAQGNEGGPQPKTSGSRQEELVETRPVDSGKPRKAPRRHAKKPAVEKVDGAENG